VSIAIGCNVIGRHNFLAHKLEAEIEYCICAIVMRITPLRSVAILPQICTVCTKLRKHVNAIMVVLYCFTAAIVLPGGASDHNDEKSTVAGLQRACKTRWLSSEATVRARSEILALWAVLKHLSETRNDAMCFVLLQLVKRRSFIMALSVC